MLFHLDLMISTKYKKNISVDEFKKEILRDYKLAYVSRECSIIGRKEVLTGKASFGIFGDGKELPQLAMAKYFKKGDFRSGYYRDQTFMFSLNENLISNILLLTLATIGRVLVGTILIHFERWLSKLISLNLVFTVADSGTHISSHMRKFILASR